MPVPIPPPPMLDRTDFDLANNHSSVCLEKIMEENIMKSILEEKERYKADIRATNILLQGIPKDIYTLINHYTDAKDIWDNVKMILEGSELTKDDRESQLYDEFERFCQIKGETIHVYYVRFSKLINDMRNIKMTMSRMQLNSKFVNNMLPEWSRFITEVKLNRGLKESNFDQLYAYLKQHEVHANENRMMMERFIQPTDDPLALVSNASNQKYPTQSSESPQSQINHQLLITDNVELLMKGSGKSLQQQKEELFNEYERFCAIGNVSIHDYFVRFHKLINDMKITQLDIPTHQMNTKFVNNLPLYSVKYVTNVKNNKDISATTYVELYTYLKSYEPHAMKTLKKQEQSTSIVDPLAYLAQTTHYHAPTQTTTLPPPQYGPLTSSTP
ncbi:hypothetical protein Tco_1110602 [Tanacetum coccineum]|uniref:Integrase, catalytic region, zinc finger, CCHC-type, peptidase aspartic, catalytic n=1 Tax=Tanacetum coccineum TaxID=301880 RepID=A0ABQ5IJ91_9ASTR